MFFLISPVGTVGRSKAQTISRGFGMAMFSFEIVNLDVFDAIAAPPPGLPPGLGVEI